jgi:hypothetical protein
LEKQGNIEHPTPNIQYRKIRVHPRHPWLKMLAHSFRIFRGCHRPKSSTAVLSCKPVPLLLESSPCDMVSGQTRLSLAMMALRLRL